MDPPALDEVRRRFPRVRWDEVRVHEGVPWLLRWKRARGMVLPCAWHPRRLHLHLARLDDDATLRHEAVHVQQYQDLGAGLGYLRPFVVAYLGWAAFRGTGRRHPMEAPAYEGRAAAPAGFWRVVAAEGPRALVPVRLLVGVVGAVAAALLAGPLVELTTPRRPPPRREAPPP